MAEYRSSIKDEIERIQKDGEGRADSVIDAAIQELCDIYDSKRLPIFGEVCLNRVRDLRSFALGQYQRTKREIDEALIAQIGRMTENDGIKRLNKKKKEIDEAKNQRDKAENDKNTILKSNNGMTEYERYQRYHKPDNKGMNVRDKRVEGEEGDTPYDVTLEQLYSGVYEAVNRTEDEYRRKTHRSIIIGIVATLLFGGTDFYLLRSLFIASNMSNVQAIATALISALALDAPPVVLGFLISRQIDTVRIWYLRDDPKDPGRVREKRKFAFTSAIMCIVIVVAFIAYFLLRLLLFLGGGDFNIVMHSILEHNFSINPSDLLKVQYSGADLISAVVPLVTSASAFAVGISVSTSEADYIKKASAVIVQELDNCVAECERKRNEYNTTVDRLKEEYENLRKEVYTYYVIKKAKEDAAESDNVSVPGNRSDAFIRNIVMAGKEIEMKSYLPIYISALTKLRQRAEDKLIRINSVLSPHVAIPAELSGMEYSESERNSLDEIWVKGEEVTQKKETQATIDKIKELTSMMLN